MFNPLVDSFAKLSDSEIEDKIIELSRKFFMTNNPSVQQQISVILEMYKEEGRARRASAMVQRTKKTDDDPENPLDNLINVS
jgi:hypothetical protein|tara:strand:+ start:240 stop:485 length:246 start_codon:yes stop_codon:yes gene_type:complete